MLAALDRDLLDLALLFGLCVATAIGFLRLRMPPAVGFVVAGALVGPYALGLVDESRVHLIESLAEVGVVMLLFTVGIELSLRQLVKMRRAVLLGGGFQVLATLGLGALAATLGGLPPGTAIFLGFLLALSSTAAVTKLLADRGEFSAPHGQFCVAVCIAQDLAVIPMILSLPILAGWQSADGGDSAMAEILTGLARTLGYLAGFVALAWVALPKVMDLVVGTRSRELFVLAVFGMCLAMAAFTGSLGLSLALGAFLAGLVLSESPYHHQAFGEVQPLRDALSSLFFVSIGMLFDWRVIAEVPGTVILALLSVILGKTLLVMVAAHLARAPLWVAVRSGFTLAQVGEFSFVLVTLAGGTGLLDETLRRTFVVVAVLSIAATPLLAWTGKRIVLAYRRTRTPSHSATKAGELSDHVVVIGFGPVGRTTAEALERLHIPYRVIEMNAATVKAERARGVPIFAGDSSRPAVLQAAGLQRARLLVVAINDPQAARRTVAQASLMAPNVRVVTRAIYNGEVAALQHAGADEVVPQELETSVEVLVRVLRRYLIPDDEVGRQVRRVRDSVPGSERAAPPDLPDPLDLTNVLQGITVAVHRVEADSPMEDSSLAEVNLRRRSGCTVVAIQRRGATDTQLDGDTRMQAGDLAVLLGPVGRIASAAVLFRSVASGDGATVAPPDPAPSSPPPSTPTTGTPTDPPAAT